MKDIVVFTHTQLDYDCRVQKQVTELAKNYNIILCCQLGRGIAEPLLPSNIEYAYFKRRVSTIGRKILDNYLIECNSNLNQIQRAKEEITSTKDVDTMYENYHVDYVEGYNHIIQILNRIPRNIKAIICNDVMMLPFGYKLFMKLKKTQTDIKLIGDMHEIHFDYSDDQTSFDQVLRTWLCDRYIPKCNLILSVSDWGKTLYQNRYPNSKVLVVRNTATYYRLKPSKNKATIRLVHIGMAQRARNIGSMIYLMKFLEQQYTLDLYLVAITKYEQDYVIELKNRITQCGLQQRVQIHTPVSQKELIKTINQYDIGIYYLIPRYHNHTYVLPNKLFEYIQARNAIVTTPLNSMREIIENYQVGKVSEDFSIESFVRAIKEVSEELLVYKKKSNKAAKQLNFKEEFKQVVDYLNQ